MAHSQPAAFARNLWLDVQASALRTLSRLTRTSHHPAHLATGIQGEREAIFHLRSQDYTIVARRWRNPRLPGDLDLIAWNAGTLCFIEVKTRSLRGALPAEMAVDSDKQKVLRRLALSYIRRLPQAARQAPMRFDVLSVYLAEKQPHSNPSESGQKSVNQSAAYLSKNAGPGFVLNKGAFEWA